MQAALTRSSRIGVLEDSREAAGFPAMSFRTVDEWIAREAIPFSVDVLSSVNGAVDELIASLEEPVELVGFGEPLHGGEEFLVLRNRLFQHLVEAHGYSAIAIESSFPRA